MSLSPRELLGHILDEADFLSRYASCVTPEQLRADDLLRRGIERSTEIIGEAVKQLPLDFRSQHAQVPWRKIAGLRDHVVHRYFGLDYELVCEVVNRHVPALAEDVRRILEGIGDESNTAKAD
jgi:uncharacterized protein with HEPN domain